MATRNKKQKIALLKSVSGISEKHAQQAVETLGIDSLDAFIAAGQRGELTKISGVGAKTEARLLASALKHREENPEAKPEESQKKKENLKTGRKVDSTISSRQPLPDLEKVSVAKLTIRLLGKILKKAITNR